MASVAQVKVGIVSGVWNHSNWSCSTSIFRTTSIEIERAITRS